MNKLGLALRSIIAVLGLLISLSIGLYVYPSYVEGQGVKAQSEGRYKLAQAKYNRVEVFKVITEKLGFKYGFSRSQLNKLIRDMELLELSNVHFRKGLAYSEQQQWEKAERELAAVIPTNIHYGEAQQKLRDNARQIAESYLSKAMEALKHKDYAMAQQYLQLVAGYDQSLDITKLDLEVKQQVQAQTAATVGEIRGSGASQEQKARQQVQVFRPEAFIPISKELKYVEYVQRYRKNCLALADVYDRINKAIDVFRQTGEPRAFQDQLLLATRQLKALQKDFSAQYYPYPKGNNIQQVRALLEALNRIIPLLDKAIAEPAAGWGPLAAAQGEFEQVFNATRTGWELLKQGDTARNQAYRFK